MVTSGLYSNLSDIGTARKFNPEKVEQGDNALPITGDGLIVMHGTRLDVDISTRISDLLNTILALTDRIILLESMAGITDNPAPMTELRLGIWRLFPSGDNLLKQVDLNKGTTVVPDWETREENTYA